MQSSLSCYICITCLLNQFFTGIADLKDVIEYVCDLNLSQFDHLGVQLGLLQTTLNKISHTKPLDYGKKVMTDWLNQVDNVQPTWNNLVKALKKKSVQGNVQANGILEDLKNKTLM